MAYSEAKKAEVLALLAANGGVLRSTAKQAGVPEATLRKWAGGNVGAGCAEDVRKKVRTQKESLADGCEQLAILLLGDMTNPEKREKAPVAALAVAFGVAVDKMRLLRGESTATVEIRDDGTIFGLLLPDATPGGAQASPDAIDCHGEGAASLPLEILGKT